MDFSTLLYGPVHDIFGVSASLTTLGTDGVTLDITVIDKTAGVEVGNSAEVQTIVPACDVMADELAEIETAALQDASITFNGRTWRVKSFLHRPSPNGVGDGEIRLLLSVT